MCAQVEPMGQISRSRCRPSPGAGSESATHLPEPMWDTSGGLSQRAITDRVGVRGHYLNRRDQEKRDVVNVFGAFSDVLAPLRELATTVYSNQER
jgi:hypothetical protein